MTAAELRAEIKEVLAEIAREAAAQNAELRAEREKRDAELRAEREKRDAEYKAAAEKREKRDAKYKAKREKEWAETNRIIKKVSNLVGGISNNNGSVAEDYFFNSFRRNKDFAHQHFDFIERNKYIANSTQHAEFDIVMYNGKSVAIIEVKYKVHKNDIDKTLAKQKQFRELVSSSQDKAIYLGLAGMAFPPEVEEETLDAGIAVIKQVGENMVVLDDRVKKF